MAADDNQDKLAQEWADALDETEGEGAEAGEAAAPEGGEEAPAEAPAEGDAEAIEPGDADPAEAMADEWAAALAENEQEDIKKEKESSFMEHQAKDAELTDYTSQAKSAPEGSKRDLDFILDIPLEVSAELGRTKLLINELLQLGQGSVIELNKLAGEPLEIYVNGKLVARGEAVVINEKFGIRLTDIISPIERVKQLA